MMVHVDGDVLVYRAGFAAEHTLYEVSYTDADGVFRTHTCDGAKAYQAFLDEQKLERSLVMTETMVYVEPEAHAIYNVRSLLQGITESLQVDPETEVRVYLSGATNFRNGVATIKPYKGNRDNKAKPVHSAAIKDYMRRTYQTVTSEDQEADDDIATAHYAMWQVDPYSSVICTVDKDLRMIPGMHYNFVTKETSYVEPDEGLRNFYRQCLTGDVTDNIPGVRGIGPLRAAKILPDDAPPDALLDAVRTVYREAYGDDADKVLLEVGRLLWIRRRPNEWWGDADGASGGSSEHGVRVPEGVPAEERSV
jgi:DNA polymerase-1